MPKLIRALHAFDPSGQLEIQLLVVQVITPQIITVDGAFQMHGRDHALNVQMVVRPDENSYSATAQFSVPLRGLGLKDPSNFLLHVSNEVDIDVETTTVLAQP